MPDALVYTRGTGAGSVSLDRPERAVGWGGGLRSHAWSYALDGHSATGLSLPAREVDVACTATHAAADEALAAFATDVAAGTPGTLASGGLSQRAYVVGSKAGDAWRDDCALTLSVLLLDGFWWRERSRELFSTYTSVLTAQSDPPPGQSPDYPHDYPWNYSTKHGSAMLDVGGVAPARCRLAFHGDVTNPYVTIAGNRYEIDVSVVQGSDAVIDGIPERPTAYVVDEWGHKTDAFSSAVRDGGAGGGSYAFEPIPPGAQEVSWSGAFGMTLTWREREVEPPWSR